jgi:polar amino acid transport system permease protein
MRSLNPGDFLFLIAAARWTILLSLLAFLGGGVIGALVAMMRVSQKRALRWCAIAYIQVFQGTPLLLQLFLIFFGTDMLGVGLSPWVAAALGLSCNAGAFLGEIWRGAIQSVSRAQREAGEALGLHYLPIMRHIILPQALRIAVAPTVGFLVNLVKSTSLAAIIGFIELTRAAQLLNNSTFRPFTLFASVAVLYFLLCWPLTIASRRLETRMARAYQR